MSVINTTIFIAHARARQGSSKSDQGKYVCRRGDLNPHALSSASPSS